MTGLVTFLRARLNEDERIARLAADDARGMGLAHDEPVQWRNSDGNLYLDGGYGSGIAVGGYGGPIGDEVVNHIARHDPARVLAEVAAKREIIDEHLNVNDGDCGTCVGGQWGYPTHGSSSPQPWPCATLRLLAAPYADHADYQQEWKP